MTKNYSAWRRFRLQWVFVTVGFCSSGFCRLSQICDSYNHSVGYKFTYIWFLFTGHRLFVIQHIQYIKHSRRRYAIQQINHLLHFITESRQDTYVSLRKLSLLQIKYSMCSDQKTTIMIPRRYVQNRLRHWGHAPFSKVVYDPLETRRYPHALL